MDENNKIALLFLGPPKVLMDGEDTTSRITAKNLALMAYLASLAPERLPRDTVATVFWSEKSDEASHYRLRHALWELRRTIGDRLLQADDRTCWLGIDDGVKVDVLEFKEGCKVLSGAEKGTTAKDIESLRVLATYYRGDLLDGINVREAPLFEEWLLSERERFQLQYLDVLWYLSRAQVTSGKLDDAVHTLTWLIEADPLRERSYRALMGVYLRQGDKTAALRVYARCANVLNNELGVSPSPATERVRRMALGDSGDFATSEFERASRLFGEGKNQEAWDICAAIEAASSDPALSSQAALLRAEIALTEGRQGESLGLVKAARQAFTRMFG